MSESQPVVPQDVATAQAWIQARIDQRAPFRICGAGSLIEVDGEDCVSSLGLQALRFFHPDDLVIGAEAGMTLAQLDGILAEKGMVLPVTPWFAGATIGGMAAVNSFGAYRMDRGGLRDFIIGIEYICGQGKRVKAGGKVVKNVTGYDLSRMMLGSRGGLGMITALHFKVMPAPQHPCTLVAEFDDLAWLPFLRQTYAAKTPIEWVQVVFSGGKWRLGIGIAGSLERRQRLLGDLAKSFAGCLQAFEEVQLPEAFQCFARSAQFGGFLAHCLSSPPNLHMHLIAPTRSFFEVLEWRQLIELGATIVAHPIGGDAHILFPQNLSEKACDAAMSKLQESCVAAGGYLVLERGPQALKQRYGLCQPLPVEYALMTRLKAKLDPHQVFRSPFFQQGRSN